MKNISIKDGLNALKRKAEPETEKTEVAITTEFDQEHLLKIWNNFINFYKVKAPSFASAIAKYQPELKDNFVIEYKVANKLIANDALNVASMLEYLKKELNNNQITLKPIIVEKTSKKVAYTDREKYEEMAEKYPSLVDLKERLNLELDF